MRLRRTHISGSIAIGLVLALAGCGASSIGSKTAAPTATKTVAVGKSSAPSAAPTTSQPTIATTPPASPAPATSQSSTLAPASVVEAYFAAIDAGDYEEAWSLGGDNLGQSYTQFVDGFSNTANDSVSIVSTSGNTVSVDLTATQTDGSEQQFTGTYTVSGNAIGSAAITQAGASSTLCGAPPNPYGYNLCGVGNEITNPPRDICTFFKCIDNFWHGNGYMVECGDGKYSKSGGIEGACSYNEGEDTAVSDGT
jgi:hypothetical protein